MKFTTYLAIGALTISYTALLHAQDTGGGNTGGTAFQEGQTSGPSGQTDFQTDLFTGRFGYSVPLELAPARHDSTPNLELLYNSANGNSWCGVGWDLDLGYIERETKYGVPILWSNGFPQHAYDSSKGFLFSFKNKTSDLVQLSTNAYRAQVQSDFLQFQYYSNSNTWVVIDKSGNQYYFGSTNSSRMINPKSGWSDGTATFHWALDTIITATGDKATISYTTAGEKLYPQTYSYNGHTNGVSALCTVQFHLSAFNRPDTTISCRSGYAVTNQYLLTGILHTVNGQTVWSNALNYTTSPSTGRSLLTSITRYGSDRSTTLPPVTFGYSQQSFTFQSPTQWGNLYRPSGGDQSFFAVTTNYNGVTTEPGEVCDLIDMDGDGLPDRIIHPVSGAPFTSLLVQHNTGSGFANPTTWTIGSQSYDGDSTSTYEDFSLIQSSHARLVDINGDGKPDWVVDPYESYFNGGNSNAMVTNYTRLNVQLNNSTNLMNAVSWTNVVQQLFGNDGAGQKGEFRAVENLQDPSDGNDYVQMIDMNGDGLPDRVMVRRTSPFTNYVVQFNTGSAFGPTNSFGPYQAQGYTTDLQWAGLAGNVGTAGTAAGSSMRLIDINGDGLPDRVSLLHSTVSSAAATPQYQSNLIVELNNGYGFEPPINWTNVNSYFDQTNGGAYTSGVADLGDDFQVAYKDVNGDGLPDRIVACVFSYFNGVQTGYTNWFVQINNGTGFNKAINWGPTYNQGFNTDTEICGIQTSETTFIDINGDGLPDRVEQVYSLNESDNYFVVSLSSGPFPDLLTLASNGLGGVVTATYKPSTQYDNSESPGSSPTRQLLPFPTYTVSSISVGDGLYPSNTTTYNYTGGYWNFALRQFNGFAETTVVDPLGTTDTHWFHQAGGRNNSAYGEYADSTNTLGKDGMEFRTDVTDSNSLPYKTTLNQVSETVLAGGQHFAFVSTNIEMDYPASGSYYRATAKALRYDTNTGNLTNTLYYGEVGSVVVSNESFSDIGSDSYYQITQFASLANPNIVDKPQSVTLSLDLAESTILRQKNYSYDGNTGNLLQERDLICPGTYRTFNFGYDSYNNRIWSTNAAGIVTQTTFDSTYETFPTQSTTAGSYTTAATYDPRSGKLTSSVNPAGLVTTNLLDVFFRLTETEVSTTANGTPNHWLEQYSYTLGTSSGVPNNSVFVKQSDGVDSVNGHEVIRYSDGLGRTAQVREESETGNFRVTDTVYDARGNPEFVSLPYFDSTSTSFVRPSGTELGTLHQYDPIGRPSQVSGGQNGTFNSTTHLLTSIAQTGGDSGSPLGTNIVAYYNGSNPWVLVVTDEAGKSHQFGLDAYGRTIQIVEVTSGGNFTTTLTYNMAGDLLTVTDNASHQIQYAYNTIGELIAMADPDMGAWQYGRDVAGRLRQQIDGDGQTVKYNYTDPLGRLANRQVYDLHSNFVYAVTNVYDSSDDGNFPVYADQLYKIIDNQGYAKFGYDVRGRPIITARYLATNGNTYTNQYTADDLDRTTSIAYPNGGPTITNIYDKGANLYEVQQVGGSNTLFYKVTSFTALDQVAGITYGNGVTASNFYYTNSHRLKSIATAKSTNVQSLAYTYDQVADIKSITDSVYSDGGSAGITNVTYDDLHRLTSLYRPTLSQTVNFSYDSIGNMTSSGENGGTYTYSPGLPHAVLSANGQSYAYDRCGNMLVRAGQSLVYDAENRLIAAVASNVVTTFGYDADGARLWKQSPTNTLQVWIDDNYEEKDGKILYHVSAGDRVVCTFDASNTVLEYYHPDHVHSAEIMSDGSGNPYQHYEYSAYGQSRYTLSGTAFPISRRFTSQMLDDETGLYYYNSRYYDPVLGRFIQPDSFIPQEINPQSYDRYGYALDNPLRFADPTGHAGKEVADWWEGHVNRVFASLTEGSESTFYIGTAGTINSIVGGIVEPLRLGSDAGRVSATGGTPGQIGIVALQEGLRGISLVPVGSAIGKGAGTLLKAAVRSGEEEVAGQLVGEVGGCFTAGTLIPCENSDIEIQNVKVGDRVWSYSFQVGEWELRTVEATPMHDYLGDVVTLRIGGLTIEVTGNHPFWVLSGTDLALRPPALDVPKAERTLTRSGRWVEARSLRPDDKLMLLDAGDQSLEFISSRQDHLSVYNLRVEGNHTYAVSQLGVLVHNKGAQVKPVPGREPDQLARGKLAHKQASVRPGEGSEVRTPSGKRMDRYNEDTSHIREIKPNNPRGIRLGEKQLEEYKKEMEALTGKPHTTEVNTYDPAKITPVKVDPAPDIKSE